MSHRREAVGSTSDLLTSSIVSKETVLAGIESLLKNSGKSIERRVAFPWLTNRIPVMGDRVTPADVVRRLADVHRHLRGDWMKRLSKKETPLTFDMLVGGSTLIEIDLANRFTSARLETLDFYYGLHHELNLRQYRSLCEKYREDADRANQTKQTADFPFPGGRNAQAAYFDFTKDLLVPLHGLRLVRLPAPQGELTSAHALKMRMLF